MPQGKQPGKVTRTGGARAVPFATPAQLRGWLEKNHTKKTELLVLFYKRGTGQPSLTWPESVDEALCFGWIDGVRKGVDASSYTIRFTPRKPSSVWSSVNVAKFEALERAGRMTDAGRRAFAHKRENRSGVYSYEQRPEELPPAYRAVLARNRRAVSDFDGRPPSYRRAAIWWVISAKAEVTRERRLARLIECHASGEPIPAFVSRPARPSAGARDA